MPEYKWYYGCSPTSGGMLMGYWFGKGYKKLLPGVTDPMVQDENVNNAIASKEHIEAGKTLGYTYGSYQNHEPNSIADFMQTENGSTYVDNIPIGLRGWTNYVGLGTKMAYHDLVALGRGSFDYSDFKAEIDQGRPMILNLFTYAPEYGWVGHSVVGYGYNDNMFTLLNPYNKELISVPGFAVMDTWKNGTGRGTQSEWYGEKHKLFYSFLDNEGREWWPFLDATITHGWSWKNVWDWQVFDGCFYQPVPLPGTLWLLGFPFVGLIIWRRLKKGCE
jgi:hypothetical protein